MTTIEEAKQYLLQAKYAKQKCIQISYKLAEIKTDSRKLIAMYQMNMGGSGIKNDINNKIIEMETQETKLETAMIKWTKTQNEIEHFIDKLELPQEDEHLRTLLLLKYVRFISFTEIAFKLGYSYDYTIKKLHVKSLKIVAKKLKETHKGEVKM